MPSEARKRRPLPGTAPCPADPPPPEPADTTKLAALAALTPDGLGTSEEDAKIRFAVPLLEALGHPRSRMRFEHHDTDILLADGLPRGSTVVVETKRPDVNLDLHLARLHMYAIEERALLALLTNGAHLRVYAPFWNRAPSFAEALLWEFERADLARADKANDLISVLSHAALASGWARAAMLGRQLIIEGTWAAAENLCEQFRQERTQLEQRLGEIERLTAELASERESRIEQLREIAPRERDKLRRLFRLRSVPIIPTSDFGSLLSSSSLVPRALDFARARPRSSSSLRTPHSPLATCRSPLAPPSLRRWTLPDLRLRATPKQRLLFAAFVRLGRRTATVAELARRSGLSAAIIPNVLAKYIGGGAKLGREPLLQLEIRGRGRRREEGQGRAYTILPRYWPLLRRLYRAGAH